MFTLQAPASRGKDFAGEYMSVLFVNGKARVSRDYVRRVLMRHGCRDLTSPEEAEESWRRPLKKVLFVRFGAFGDNLIITPAIRAFRRLHPDATIHVLGRSPQDQIWLHNPDINGILNLRASDLGFVARDYDEVIDFTQMIEGNPEADWRNATEIACDWAHAHPDPSLGTAGYRPVYMVTPEEKQIGASILAEHGIDVDKDEFIVLHPESTCPIRMLPGGTVAEIAERLVDLGYKVVLPTKVNYFSNPPDSIVSLHDEISSGQLSPRYGVAACSYATAFICVDSFYSHIAAALNKPSTLIYGPFDPALRAKYYRNAHIIFNPLSCGPCQQALKYCARYPGQIPPCMSQYTAEEIVDTALRSIEGPRDPGNDPIEIALPKPEEIRSCPGCEGKSLRVLTRKGNNFYLCCQRCGSILLDKRPSDAESDEIYMPSRAYISQYASLIKQVCQHHLPEASKAWILTPYEISHELNEDFGYAWQIETQRSAPAFRADIAVSLFQMEQVYNPEMFLEHLLDHLADEGLIMLYGPTAEGYTGRNNWAPLNAPVAGQNCTLLSEVALRRLALLKDLEVLKYDRIGDNALIVLKRKAS